MRGHVSAVRQGGQSKVLLTCGVANMPRAGESSFTQLDSLCCSRFLHADDMLT